ncbi:hypothetical protein [Streptomyces iranensis]|uniref:Secreted protein n=1 Tax=Streptomyces iranensis TaxID=576784 RepID=A0A060ZZP6_9ACTN|nr:hypothetical protein [Streptomyces iranensis]MBP2065288.1 hypothetical protein [Streptomyces iranensis]CDR08619.1 predicted protein [Streptomyces iranensis]
MTRSKQVLTACALAVGVLGGVMNPALANNHGTMAPADNHATAMAKERKTGGVHIQRTIAKKAKNVRGKPPRKAVCISVHRPGGSPTYGKACFQPHGDRFWIKDKRSDGFHIKTLAMPRGNTQTWYECKDLKGKRAGWTRCGFSKSMKENTGIVFWVLAMKGDKTMGQSRQAPARS